MRLTLKLLLLTVVAFAIISGCDAPGPSDPKSTTNSNGATKISDLQKDGDYYVVKGADLHNLGSDLIGKKIEFRGKISDISHVPSNIALILSEDNCYYVQLPFGALGDIPTDLKTQFDKNGLQPGNTITLWATVNMIMPESGVNRSVLKYKSCMVKPVDKWER